MFAPIGFLVKENEKEKLKKKWSGDLVDRQLLDRQVDLVDRQPSLAIAPSNVYPFLGGSLPSDTGMK